MIFIGDCTMLLLSIERRSSTIMGTIRKVVLMLLLSAVSNSAVADWVKVSNNATYDTYANPATIRKADNRVQMWVLFDNKTVADVGGMQFMSIKHQAEYNCKERKFRALYFSYHTGNMGSGEVVYVNSDLGEWLAIEPGSAGEALWETACGKHDEKQASTQQQKASMAADEKEKQSPLMDMDDLRVDFASLKGQKVRLEGVGQYMMDSFMLKKNMMDMNPIIVDISKVHREQRRQILQKCSNIMAGCAVTVYGTVEKVNGLNGIFAERIEW